jgi:hypothetical protein
MLGSRTLGGLSGAARIEEGLPNRLDDFLALNGTASTVPPHTNCSIKMTSRIITSTAMTRLMVLFILTSPLK